MDKAQAQELLVDAKSVFLNNYKMKEALRIGVEAIEKQIEKKVIWREGCTFVCPPDCGERSLMNMVKCHIVRLVNRSLKINILTNFALNVVKN